MGDSGGALGRKAALLRLDTVGAVRVAVVVSSYDEGTVDAGTVMAHPMVRPFASSPDEFLFAVAHAVWAGAVTAWRRREPGQLQLFDDGRCGRSLELAVSSLVLSTGDVAAGLDPVSASELTEAAAGQRGEAVQASPLDENIYELHERVLGPYGHSRQQQLALLEEDYPAAWIHRAFEIAATREVRNLSYIVGILRSWRDRGPDRDVAQREPDRGRGGYVENAAPAPFPWERDQ